MPKFTVEHNSSKTPEDAYAAAKSLLGNEIKKFDANAKATFDDSSKSCKIAGGQFKADLSVVGSGAGSKVAILVDLPLLLTPFKGKVQETLQRMLAKHLA